VIGSFAQTRMLPEQANLTQQSFRPNNLVIIFICPPIEKQSMGGAKVLGAFFLSGGVTLVTTRLSERPSAMA